MKSSSTTTRGSKAQTLNYKVRNSNKFIPIIENKIKEKSDPNITTMNSDQSNSNSLKDLHKLKEGINPNGEESIKNAKNIKQTLLENSSKNATNKIKILKNRKGSPNEKAPSNQFLNSVKKIESKLTMPGSINKSGISPIKTKIAQDNKKNFRLNPNYYTASFIQDLSTKKETIETSASNKNTKSNKEVLRDNSVKSIKSLEQPNLFTNNFMEICSNLKNIIDQTQEEINSKDRDIKDFSFLNEIDKFSIEIEDLYKKAKEKEQMNSAFEEKFESTKFNINLIKSSSERRDSVYKKYLKMCNENMTEINDIIKKVFIDNPQSIKDNLIFEQNITTNIINNITHNSSNNVNVNVNLNLNTINNVSNIQHKEKPNNFHKLTKLMSRKKISKKQFYNFMKNNEEDLNDSSQSLMSEGVIIKMPFKLYQVNKPKDDLTNLRILTDGDFIDSDDNSDFDFDSDNSELIDIIDEKSESLIIGRKIKKKNNFVKTRSKSFLGIRINNNLLTDIDDSKIKIKKKNMIKMFNDMSLSKVLLIFILRLTWIEVVQ